MNFSMHHYFNDNNDAYNNDAMMRTIMICTIIVCTRMML